VKVTNTLDYHGIGLVNYGTIRYYCRGSRNLFQVVLGLPIFNEISREVCKYSTTVPGMREVPQILQVQRPALLTYYHHHRTIIMSDACTISRLSWYRVG
jgi:hypothetical protein